MAAGLSLAALTALAAHGIAEGWSAAGVIVSDGAAVSTVAVTLCLTATVKGAAAGVHAHSLRIPCAFRNAGVFCNHRHPQA